MNALINKNSAQPGNPQKPLGDETVNEIRQGVKFRPVLHALTANPGVELMNYAAGRENMITLGQGEGDAPTPDFICRATFSAMQNGKTVYGPALGQAPLRQALSDYYDRIYKLAIPASRIFVTASGSTAMHLSLAALLDKGDEVAAITPIWKNLLGAIELTQATTRQVALDYHPDKGWKLDLQKLFDSCNARTKVILIVSPSNPTGWSATKEEMQAILKFARERGIWILADEVYGRLVYESTHEHMRADSFLDIAEPDDLLLVVNSFSKSWAMTGWRLGWIVGPPLAETKIRDVALYNNLCPPTFTQYGAIAALEQGEPFLKEQIDLWRANRDLLVRRFADMPRISQAFPAATFYSFFKVDGEPDCIALTKRLIDEAQLLLSPGVGFGEAGRGYIRMCFAVSERRLSEALDRLEKVVSL
ncbi:MAG: pyridoxal phosphate-dependent aminotransferase [Alphaproteobacteria bacterium]|nr:pyridoxal phosphate-dependent aminotransferase [Alphaproteobacteria bacterium]